MYKMLNNIQLGLSLNIKYNLIMSKLTKSEPPVSEYENNIFIHKLPV